MSEFYPTRIGCVSWTYPDWRGTFYPQRTRPEDFLPYYSRVFDIVEVDSSFYRTPTSAAVKQWRDKTPKDFLFTVKVPKRITHDSKLRYVANDLNIFQGVIKGLGTKLACVIAQMPPVFRFEKHFDTFKGFLDVLDPSIRYAVEFRNESWSRDEVVDLLKERRVSLVWSIGKYSDSGNVPKVTTDFLYLRFMGQFGEFPKFDHVQREKTEALKQWANHLNCAGDTVKQTYVLMSNHFEGFAPATANAFRKLLGLPLVRWGE